MFKTSSWIRGMRSARAHFKEAKAAPGCSGAGLTVLKQIWDKNLFQNSTTVEKTWIGLMHWHGNTRNANVSTGTLLHEREVQNLADLAPSCNFRKIRRKSAKFEQTFVVLCQEWCGNNSTQDSLSAPGWLDIHNDHGISSSPKRASCRYLQRERLNEQLRFLLRSVGEGFSQSEAALALANQSNGWLIRYDDA